jgi:polyphosphate kinase
MNKVLEYKYNREKSWLAFNARVLQEAGIPSSTARQIAVLGIFRII